MIALNATRRYNFYYVNWKKVPPKKTKDDKRKKTPDEMKEAHDAPVDPEQIPADPEQIPRFKSWVDEVPVPDVLNVLRIVYFL